jgi:AAA15 family ATPase/GTPase
MLHKILIENYRCYEKHEIEFKNISILVGKNNAGKSTVIEALRLLAIAASRYKTINYQDPPTWTGLPKIKKGLNLL